MSYCISISDKHTLIIHRFNALFKILNEFRNLFNFRLISLNTDEIDKNLNKNNYLVITGKKNSKISNQIIIKEFPIDILKLVEIININFLKNKFYQQNNIKIGNYNINLNSRIMNKDSQNLSLTEKEAKIIIYLNKSKKPKSIFDLQKEVWDHKSKLETHTVETHIYRLRKKIEKKFNDKIFISSLKGGYKLNA